MIVRNVGYLVGWYHEMNRLISIPILNSSSRSDISTHLSDGTPTNEVRQPTRPYRTARHACLRHACLLGSAT